MTAWRLAPTIGSLAVALALVSGTHAAAQESTPSQPPPALPRPEADRPTNPDETAPPVADDVADAAQEPDSGATRNGGRRTRGSAITARLSGLAGFQSFSATDSFKAVLDSSSGPVFGGGAGLLFGRNLFLDVMVSRFSADGSRVFVTEGGEVFDLGIDTTVTVLPVDVSIGWRFAGRPRLGASGRPVFRPVPFAGGGFGFQRYRETAEFADAGDDVDETHGSYHALGGLEVPFNSHLGITTDVLYRWVPDAIGQGGVSAVYDDTDLGGLQVRFRITYTF